MTGGVRIARATDKEDDSSVFSEEDKSQQSSQHPTPHNIASHDRSRSGTTGLPRPGAKNMGLESGDKLA